MLLKCSSVGVATITAFTLRVRQRQIRGSPGRTLKLGSHPPRPFLVQVHGVKQPDAGDRPYALKMKLSGPAQTEQRDIERV